MADRPTPAEPAHGRLHGPWLVLVVVCFAQFMVVLDATIVNVAMPSIQTDLELSNANLQWVVNAYTLVFGGFLLLGGRAADLVGRRQIFVIGTIVFSAASLVNALAQSGEMLIVARGFQGLGGALVSPAALSIVTTTFEEGPQRTKALAVWGGIAAGGAAFGLLLGGLLTETINWRWNFLINVPIGALVVIAATRYVPESRAAGARRHFDVAGAVSVTSGLMLLVYAIVKAQEWGWGSTRTLGVASAALALLAIFIAIELRSPAPLVRLSFFKLRWITVANFTMFAVAGGMFGMFFFASLYLQRILGFGPLKTGIGFLPVTICIMAGAAISQQLVNRIGIKPVVIAGLTLTAIGLSVLAATTAVDGTYPRMLAGMLPMSLGMGMTFVPLTLVATAGLAAHDAGLASGVFNTSQQIGGALGLAVLATLASDKTASMITKAGAHASDLDRATALTEGFQTAFIASAILMAAGLLVVTMLLRKRDIGKAHIGDAVAVAA